MIKPGKDDVIIEVDDQDLFFSAGEALTWVGKGEDGERTYHLIPKGFKCYIISDRFDFMVHSDGATGEALSITFTPTPRFVVHTTTSIGGHGVRDTETGVDVAVFRDLGQSMHNGVPQLSSYERAWGLAQELNNANHRRLHGEAPE